MESAFCGVTYRMTHSSEIAFDWFGASTNYLPMLFASRRTVIKSPTLKPKLIVTVNTALSLPYRKKS